MHKTNTKTVQTVDIRFKVAHSIHLFCQRTQRTGGHAVAHLDQAVRYKLEGRGFDSRLCHRNFSLT